MRMNDAILELRSFDGAASKTERVGWNTAKLSGPVSDYKRIHAIITVERTDDNGTANSVRARIHGDDFLLTGFTGRSLKL